MKSMLLRIPPGIHTKLLRQSCTTALTVCCFAMLCLAKKEAILSPVDSMIQKLTEMLQDSSKVLLLNKLSMEFRFTLPEEGLKYARQSAELSRQINYTSGLATALHSTGELNREQGDYKESIETFLQALSLFEELEDKEGIGACLNSIGVVYDLQGNFEPALEYYRKSLELNRELKDKRGTAIALMNLGIVYKNLNNFDRALDHYEESMQLFQEINLDLGIAKTLLNIGNIYYYKGNLNLAVAHYTRAAEIHERMENLQDWALSLENIGWAYGAQGKYGQAIEYANKSLSIAQRTRARYVIIGNHENLMTVYQEMKDYENACKHLKIHEVMKDSLFNEEKSKEIGKLEATYEFRKAEIEEKHQAEREAAATQHAEKRRNNLQYSGISIFLALIFIALMLAGKPGRHAVNTGILSRLKASPRLIKGFTFLIFLLFFEFCLVVLDPFIERYSLGAPAIKLGFNALMAGMIFPIHNFIEEKVRRRLLAG